MSENYKKMWDKLYEMLETQRDGKYQYHDSMRYSSSNKCELIMEIMEEIEKENGV